MTPFYNEFLCYTIASLFWANLDLPENGARNQLRLLLVADPQLVGFNDLALFGSLSRMDCDRYLRNNFNRAYNHVRPDVIVFLGDLLDEGSTATDNDYEIYVQRFQSVFQTPTPVQKIYIPGDNDVGGEGFDKKTTEKIQRFWQHFIEPEEQQAGNNVVAANFVDFYRMNLDFSDTAPQDYLDALTQMRSKQRGKFTILLNHMPLVMRYDISSILKAANPNLMLTGHHHTAKITTCINCHESTSSNTWQGNSLHVTDSKIYDFDLTSKATISEVAVPTCSYRMGVQQMGYGAAVINDGGQMRYTVLWLPSRYLHLFLYIFVLVMIVIVSVFFGLCQLILNQNHRYALPMYRARAF